MKEPLRKFVEEKVGERCFYAREITDMTYSLGRRIGPSAVGSSLKPSRIVPSKIGASGSRAHVSLYPESAVWAYLRELEASGRIRLREHGIGNFDDILEKGHHRVVYSSLPGKARRSGHDGDDESPSWQNAVRTREGD
ncbi:MAG: hypothetical protein HYW25_00780 [Candidatus Aenigmarchaeota archaeon]|nr:hypothetical protein [Candidatus Aenigmarchaeota archaeon]